MLSPRGDDPKRKIAGATQKDFPNNEVAASLRNRRRRIS